MGDWSGYALADFLQFTPSTYFRQYELINGALWPLQVPMLIAASIAVWLNRRNTQNSARRVYLLLAPAWLAVGWWFLFERYAPINFAAEPFALAFALQALLLIAVALAWRERHMAPSRAATRLLGQMLVFYGLVVHPLLGPATGRSWSSVEIFGLAPDPTALVTLGLLLDVRSPSVPWLMMIPLCWCLFSGLTYVAMGLEHGLLTPALALLAVIARFALVRRPERLRSARR